MRKNGIGMSVCLLAALAWCGLAQAAGKAAPKAEASAKETCYAAWRTFGAPLPAAAPSVPAKTGAGKVSEAQLATAAEQRQEQRMKALGTIEEAVAADPKNVSYQTTLGYFALAAGQYQKAKQAVDAAIQRERRQPLLYLLRGQADATLAMLDPVKASKSIGPAIAAFDEAAKMDPQNSLALLQAASVAFDVDRLDLATPRLQQALARPALRLYQLPVPMDLEPKSVDSLRKWEQLQLTFWMEMVLPRCANVSGALLRLGDRQARTGDLDGALAYYHQALDISRQVGSAQPHVFISLVAGMNMMEEAYQRLAGASGEKQKLAEAKSAQAKAQQQDSSTFDEDAKHWKDEVERWNGERGVLQVGRGDLLSSLQVYQASIEKQPPATAEEMLDREAKAVAWTMNGVGLTSGPAQPPYAAAAAKKK